MRWLVLIVLVLASLARADESERTWTTDDGVRILVNTPERVDANKPTLVVLYACPNGNTIEQTMGARLEPGMDWHFDIQHVAAQTRKLREIDPERNIVLACVEADTKSWPGWRKKHSDNSKRIRAIVDEVSRAAPGSDKRLALAAHSGGGSFIFGYINGGDAIGDDVERIAFLDANYGYDDADRHGDKLLAWLARDSKRRLIVIAYDDRDVTLNGKKIVSDTGGTYRASERMIERLGQELKFKRGPMGPFTHVGNARDGGSNATFLVHTNPDKKILHTVLVERNGLLHALTVGTDLQWKWGGAFFGERAYASLIQPATSPTAAPAKSHAARSDERRV